MRLLIRLVGVGAYRGRFILHGQILDLLPGHDEYRVTAGIYHGVLCNHEKGLYRFWLHPGNLRCRMDGLRHFS
jgi:hypothetical protein